MDSLAVSAIALAAGGWQNVKLVGIYTAPNKTLPAWKLGICSTLSLLHNKSDTSGAVIGTGQNTVLVAPGSRIFGFYGSNSGSLVFSTTTIAESHSANDWEIEYTAVLFTW